MLPSLLLATALAAPAAPVPAGLALPAGLAPHPMYLRADDAGQVNVIGTVTQMVTVNRTVVVNENGKNVAKVEQVQMPQTMSMRTALGDIAGKFATVGGAELTGAEAALRVKNGAVVFVSADGKPVEKGWLRGLGEDAIVVTTDTLKNMRLAHGGAFQATTPAPRLVMLAAGDDGKVRVDVNPNAGNNFDDPFGNRQIFVNNGIVQAMPAVGVANAPVKKPLDDVRFDAYDLAGQRVSRADALKRLKNGGLVLLAGDHRLPDEAYLKAIKGELLVLASADLVPPPPAFNNLLPRVVAMPAVRVMPAVPVLPLPAIKVQAVKPALKIEVIKPDQK